jgi:hypothetical protein
MSKWSCNFTKSFDKLSVIVGKAQKLLNFFDCVWCFPVLNCFYYSAMADHTDLLGWYNNIQL